MILGFTGTREEPTEAQKTMLREFILHDATEEITQFHHGCCKGSDATAHLVFKEWFGDQSDKITLHPPDKTIYEMEYTDWEYANCIWWRRKDYLARDRDIVECVDRVFAFAKEFTDIKTVRSGTWYTVRYAITQNKPVDVCYPSGKVVKY